jgi:hypothetical protein
MSNLAWITTSWWHLVAYVSKSPAVSARIRFESTRLWQAKLLELEGEERRLHATLDAGVEAIVSGKRVSCLNP